MLDTLHVSALPNGIRVVTLAKPEAEGVQVAIRAQVGSRNEPEPLNGASHFIEHMLFKGTKRRSAKAISQAIEGQGGLLNAYTDRDTTCYYARVPYDKTRVALDVLGDLFYDATFDPKELERERHVVAEEIRMYDDQPDSVALDRLALQLWAGHPLGRPIAGTIDGVLSMSRADILAYRAANYAPSRTVFSFAGRVDHDACVKAVDRLAGAIRDPERLRDPEPYTRAIPLDPFSLTRRDIQQTQLAFGWRTPGILDGRCQAFAFLSGLLGESMMSRLFQSIREKAFRCAKAILAEVRRLAERPVPAAEMRRTRDYLCGRFRLRMDGTPIGWAVSRVLAGLPTDPEAVLDALRAVTAEDVRALAREFLAPDGLAMAVVAPNKARHDAQAWARLMNY